MNGIHGQKCSIDGDRWDEKQLAASNAHKHKNTLFVRNLESLLHFLNITRAISVNIILEATNPVHISPVGCT